jgi:predicted secreted protein
MKTMKKKLLAGAFLLVAAGMAGAQGMAAPPLQGVLNITSTASVEVTKDLLAITFSVTRDGADAGTVQSALKQALDAALAEARKAARPQEVEVSTGNFSLYPRYAQKGGINGWQGSAELTVEGRDMAAIAQLSGRIQTMSISRVSYNLSREARAKVEADVTAQAIARFRKNADELARQFGYGGASVREVNVSTNEPSSGPVPMMRMKTASASMADEAMPFEAGKGTVSATVSGSVQMK